MEGEKHLTKGPRAFVVCAHTHSIHVDMCTVINKRIHSESIPIAYRAQKGNEGGLACEQERVESVGAGAQGLGWGDGTRVGKRVTDRG